MDDQWNGKLACPNPRQLYFSTCVVCDLLLSKDGKCFNCFPPKRTSMVSRSYVEGMIIGAELKLSQLFWFQFIKRAKCRAFIMACNIILENE